MQASRRANTAVEIRYPMRLPPCCAHGTSAASALLLMFRGWAPLAAVNPFDPTIRLVSSRNLLPAPKTLADLAASTERAG